MRGVDEGVEAADCSLCCQQKEDSDPGEGLAEEARARRQERPAEVMPWQVREGSRESARTRRDSGVFAMKGIVWLSALSSGLVVVVSVCRRLWWKTEGLSLGWAVETKG